MYDASLYDRSLAPTNYWASEAPPLNLPRPLEACADVVYDVAILGAGFTGLSAAYHLAKLSKLTVCVLEAGKLGPTETSMRIVYLFAAVILLIGALWQPAPVWASEWEVVDEEDDPGEAYVLYRRPKPGSRFPEYKIEGLIKSSPESVMNAWHTTAVDDRYAPKGHTRKRLQQSENEMVMYTIIDAPIVSRRDLTTRITISRDPARNLYGVSWKNADEMAPPKPEGVVRVPASSGSWRFEAGPNGQTKVTGVSHTDFAGSVPAWLVRSGTEDFVVGLFQSYREICGDQE